MRKTAGGCFVACDPTVQAEERVPGVAAVKEGADEEFRKGGVHVVNSVVEGGICGLVINTGTEPCGDQRSGCICPQKVMM